VRLHQSRLSQISFRSNEVEVENIFVKKPGYSAIINLYLACYFYSWKVLLAF